MHINHHQSQSSVDNYYDTACRIYNAGATELDRKAQIAIKAPNKHETRWCKINML